jgi:hypothetical protein
VVEHGFRILDQTLEEDNRLFRLKGTKAGDGATVEEMVDPSSVPPELLAALRRVSAAVERQ